MYVNALAYVLPQSTQWKLITINAKSHQARLDSHGQEDNLDVTAFSCKLWIYYKLMLIEEVGQRRGQKSDFKFYLQGIRLWVTKL